MRIVVFLAAISLSLLAVPVSAHSEYDAVRSGLRVPVFTDGAWVLPQPSSSGRRTQFSGSGYSAQIEEACAHYDCDPGYLESVMMCESGGDHSAVAYNPESGNYTYGIFQIDAMWGGQYMSATEQIWFAAEHLTKGDIYWVCG